MSVNPRDDTQSMIALDAGKVHGRHRSSPASGFTRMWRDFQWPTLKAFTTGIVWTVG